LFLQNVCRLNIEHTQKLESLILKAATICLSISAWPESSSLAAALSSAVAELV